MYFYDYDEERFVKCPTELIQLHCFLQELRLWKGENPVRTELGVDYFGIFEKRRYAESEINKIITKYKDKFLSLRIDSIEPSEDQSVLRIALFIGLKEEMYRVMVEI